MSAKTHLHSFHKKAALIHMSAAEKSMDNGDERTAVSWLTIVYPWAPRSTCLRRVTALLVLATGVTMAQDDQLIYTARLSGLNEIGPINNNTGAIFTDGSGKLQRGLGVATRKTFSALC